MAFYMETESKDFHSLSSMYPYREESGQYVVSKAFDSINKQITAVSSPILSSTSPLKLVKTTKLSTLALKTTINPTKKENIHDVTFESIVKYIENGDYLSASGLILTVNNMALKVRVMEKMLALFSRKHKLPGIPLSTMIDTLCNSASILFSSIEKSQDNPLVEQRLSATINILQTSENLLLSCASRKCKHYFLNIACLYARMSALNPNALISCQRILGFIEMDIMSLCDVVKPFIERLQTEYIAVLINQMYSKTSSQEFNKKTSEDLLYLLSKDQHIIAYMLVSIATGDQKDKLNEQMVIDFANKGQYLFAEQHMPLIASEIIKASLLTYIQNLKTPPSSLSPISPQFIETPFTDLSPFHSDDFDSFILI